MGNIVGEHVKFDMLTNDVALFGNHVGQQIQAKQCSRHECCLIWPLCLPTIDFIKEKVQGEICTFSVPIGTVVNKGPVLNYKLEHCYMKES